MSNQTIQEAIEAVRAVLQTFPGYHGEEVHAIRAAVILNEQTAIQLTNEEDQQQFLLEWDRQGRR